MLKKIFAPGTDSFCTSFGLLVLRLWLGLTMLLNHGMSKFLGFSKMASEFPDPLGLGHAGSLALVVLAEFFCSLLLIAGAVTRLAAFILAINVSVAFFIAHKGALSGSHSGELAFIYLAGYVVLLIAGPGRLSADQKWFAGEPKTKSSKPQ